MRTRTLTLCGKEFRINMTYNDIADAEAYMTKDAMKCAVDGSMGFGDIRGMLFQAIRGQHGIRTPEDAGRLIQESGDLVTVATMMASIMSEMFPLRAEEEAEEGNPLPPEAEPDGDGQISSTLRTVNWS